MKFAVETWSPDYANPTEADLAPAEEPVDLAVELPPAAWAPVTPAPGPAIPSTVLFVDGVQRIDVRVWINDGVDVHPGLCASYAAGVVRCDAQAEVIATEVGRALFCRATGEAADITTCHGTFPLRATAADDPESLSLALHAARQELEVSVATKAAGTGELLVVDGPLGARRVLPSTVGYIKTHQVDYLPAGPRAVIGQLSAGQRSPVFCIGDRFARHSWYLRLPGELAHPWSGVVRCEAASGVDAKQAVTLADQVSRLLPRFASVAHKDPRAPQNLFPIAGLERDLRRRLGDPLLLQRALREASRTASTAAGDAPRAG